MSNERRRPSPRDRDDERRCYGCRQWKPRTAEHFDIDRIPGRLGFSSACKDCRRKRQRVDPSIKTSQRARRSAFIRLARLYPDQYRALYEEELRKERKVAL